VTMIAIASLDAIEPDCEAHSCGGPAGSFGS
jgi:hypothetical protein